MSDVYHIKKVVKCSTEWCDADVEIKGMCRNCYHRVRRNNHDK